jgi:hypothetical protein
MEQPSWALVFDDIFYYGVDLAHLVGQIWLRCGELFIGTGFNRSTLMLRVAMLTLMARGGDSGQRLPDT